MIDEFAIYNLAIKYPNMVDLVREVERIAIEEYRQRLVNAFEPVEEHEQMELDVVIADVNRLAKALKEQK